MTLRVVWRGSETPLAGGGRRRSVADADLFGELRMAAWLVARCLDFAGGEAGTLTADPGATIAYVAAGAGSAEIDGRDIRWRERLSSGSRAATAAGSSQPSGGCTSSSPTRRSPA